MTEAETEVLREGGAGGGHLRLPGVKLIVVEGPDRGREAVARSGTLRIGTAADNDLVLTDGAVSRHHLEVRLRNDDVRVVDRGSTNGTRIDGVRVYDAVLSGASLIQIGATAIRAVHVDEPVVVPLSSQQRFGGLIGRSAAMREAFAVLERASVTDATVLLEGETGTGKELAAEGVHQASPRSDGPFVTLDCGAMAANLIESELFGHKKGSFTGATADRVGVFVDAQGGTLFLDEIGELPLELQPKLLRALEKREVRPVGENRPVPVDVRVVAATNRDLAAEVNAGRFREDLYYRLAVVRVRLPPLRARREDIGMLVRHFVDSLGPGGPAPSEELVRALEGRAWPGNVRELRNAVERALAMMGPDAEGTPTEPEGDVKQAMAGLFGLPIKVATERWTASFERAYVEHALRSAGGSVTGAARLAGVNRRYIQRLMKRHDMRADDGDDGDG